MSISIKNGALFGSSKTPAAETYRNVKLQSHCKSTRPTKSYWPNLAEAAIPVQLDEVPKDFIAAILNTEDKRFYEHHGIDFISLANDSFGLISMLGPNDTISGASTIRCSSLETYPSR